MRARSTVATRSHPLVHEILESRRMVLHTSLPFCQTTPGALPLIANGLTNEKRHVLSCFRGFLAAIVAPYRKQTGTALYCGSPNKDRKPLRGCGSANPSSREAAIDALDPIRWPITCRIKISTSLSEIALAPGEGALKGPQGCEAVNRRKKKTAKFFLA